MKFIFLFSFLFLVSCSTVNSGTGVYLDKGYGWYNNTSSESIKSLTLKIVNNDVKDITAEVVCYYMPEDKIFGERSVFVKSNNSKVFTIKGFTRSSEKVGCKIETIK